VPTWNCFDNCRLNWGANAEGCRHALSDISRRTPLKTFRFSRQPLVNRSGHRSICCAPTSGLRLCLRGPFGSLGANHLRPPTFLGWRARVQPGSRGPPGDSAEELLRGRWSRPLSVKVFAILERRCSDALTAPTLPPMTAGAALCAPPPTRPRRIKNHASHFSKKIGASAGALRVSVKALQAVGATRH
jgi:hypothetical protein